MEILTAWSHSRWNWNPGERSCFTPTRCSSGRNRSFPESLPVSSPSSTWFSTAWTCQIWPCCRWEQRLLLSWTIASRWWHRKCSMHQSGPAAMNKSLKRSVRDCLRWAHVFARDVPALPRTNKIDLSSSWDSHLFSFLLWRGWVQFLTASSWLGLPPFWSSCCQDSSNTEFLIRSQHLRLRNSRSSKLLQLSRVSPTHHTPTNHLTMKTIGRMDESSRKKRRIFKDSGGSLAALLAPCSHLNLNNNLMLLYFEEEMTRWRKINRESNSRTIALNWMQSSFWSSASNDGLNSSLFFIQNNIS